MNITAPSVTIIDMEDYSVMLKKIERIGRVCYKSERNITETSAEQFVKNILANGHESVIEHESVTVKVICDRGVTHEIVRHRLASYSQESTRYCNYSGDKFNNSITVIDIASGFGYDLNNETDAKKYEVWNKAMKASEEYYFELLKLGAAPQEARAVLPNSLKTELIMTMNLREWRHFFKLRLSKKAHPQMREIANLIYDEFIKAMPVFFSKLDIS
ncbi:MAG: FAD-dependent thymidylate synthase [Lachnospiraceae bacterium]|nr:FAD-dependent thymidylate synthase [Lachnospiraceae bacterium]